MTLLRPIRMGTVFSGVGAPEMAIRQAGIPHRITFACESDQYARATYRRNFRDPPEGSYYHDVRDMVVHRDEIDLLVGGPPCQTFSTAGDRAGVADPRGNMIFEFNRILTETRPPMFLFENVPGLLSMDDGLVWQFMIDYWNDTGYSVFVRLLNTADFGIPQSRIRIFACGFKSTGGLRSPFPFPATRRLETVMRDYLQDDVDEKYVVPPDRVERVLHHYPGSGVPHIDAPKARTLRASQYTKATNAGDANYVSCPGGIRALTPRECFRLQGFPDTFKFGEHLQDDQLYRQAGNAMSVNVVLAMLPPMVRYAGWPF